jgi:uracil-DNA glycosylase
MAGEAEQQLRAYVEYLRDLGVHDFYRQGEPVYAETVPVPPLAVDAVSVVEDAVDARRLPAKPAVAEQQAVAVSSRPQFLEPPIAKLVSFDDLVPLPATRVAAAHKAEALVGIKTEIGDCTRCPLAYAGRRTIVFGDGDANARLMFVGEGPGADEDASGIPFVGKAGQLLNNMIQAMGLKREEVYIANIVKCRPPANRVPEPVEANTCDQFLLQQIDVVQPQVIVALGSTAAMYLLGVKQSLSALRGRWHSCRGAKLAVTYHPAYLLRDPAMKGEAWKDLQRVMSEMGLKGASRG